MTGKLTKVLWLGLFSLLIPAVLFAQKEDRRASAASSLYLISAKAGAVNYVSGNVYLANKTTNRSRVLKGDSIEAGDRVATGQDGRAEVLLNPGSFVRVAENS